MNRRALISIVIAFVGGALVGNPLIVGPTKCRTPLRLSNHSGSRFSFNRQATLADNRIMTFSNAT